MKNLFWLVSAVLITLILGVFVVTSNPGSQIVEAVGSGSESACDNASNADTNPNDNESTTPFTFNFDVGSGNVVSGVCIKTGSGLFGDSHSGMLGNGSYENGCYTVSGVGTQFLSVTRNFLNGNDKNGPVCKGISHLDIDKDPAPSLTPTVTPSTTPSVTPSTTPSVTPSVSPSVTPTDRVTPTPTEKEEEPTPTPTEGEDGTPTPTVTETPTNTPTPTTGGGTGGPGDGLSDGRSDGRSDGLSDGRSSAPQKQGEVLGATTIAKTGTFDSTFATIQQALGAAIATLGAAMYGKKKASKKSK